MWILVFLTLFASAQDGFAPPPPPPLDGQEFDELEDDIDMGDDSFRPPPPIPSTGAAGGAPNTPPNNGVPEFRPSGGGGGGSSNFGQTTGKLRFQVVDGEFYEKGKKRSRGRQLREKK